MIARSCNNLNHSRSNAPVRFCPQCGAVVNAHVIPRRCTETNHDRSRRNQNFFCVDCGHMLRNAYPHLVASRR